MGEIEHTSGHFFKGVSFWCVRNNIYHKFLATQECVLQNVTYIFFKLR